MIYAIDFGTSNSLLSAATKEKVFNPIPLDPMAKDPSIFRSVLYYPSKTACFFGAEAIKEYSANDMEGRLIRSIKKFLPMRSFVGTFVDDRALYLEDIIATFLGEMRRRANRHFNLDVDSVLLGRPARFSESDSDDRFAQDRLESAARKGGFKNIGFCPEPLAAAYEFQSTLKKQQIVFVADFGGGTSDFTVIRLEPQKENQRGIDVLSLGGVSVAGDAIDGSIMRRRISSHFGADVQFKAPFGENVLSMPKTLVESICSPAELSVLKERDAQEFFRNVREWSLTDEHKKMMDNLSCLIHEQIGFALFEKIESTKIALSILEKTEFTFDYSQIAIRELIMRSEFNEYAGPSFARILKSLDDTVKAAGLTFADIDLVCATGGTAKVLALTEALELRFGKEKIQQHKNFHSIVHGLSRFAQGMI